MIEIFNQQRKIKIRAKDFRQFVDKIGAEFAAASDKNITVVFVSDAKMRRLNKQFRGKNYTTDVLSFPFEADAFDADADNLGEIIIATGQAQKQANENDLTFAREVEQLILHGVLHLCGFDHETDDGAMDNLELQLRIKLKVES